MMQIFTFLSDTLINALGWTFVHSLWQGSLIALLMTAFLSRVPAQAAQTRYRIAACSLMSVLICAIATFCSIYPWSASGVTESSLIFEPAFAVSTSETGSSGLYYWITQLNPLFVSVWVMGVVLFTLRFGVGLVYLRHLKVTAIAPPRDWQETLDGIVRKLGHNKYVRLAQSRILRIPVVVGSVKPVILFPIGIINQLDAAEVEAILAHEVAHLTRNDFVHNLIQSLIEVVFYYHPAVWWISAIVRSERENCCDDLAIKVCGNSLTYAKALVSLEDISYSAPALALPFAGSKGHLLNRIKRILNQPQNKSNVMEKVIATVILIGCVTLLSFSYKDNPVPAPEEKTISVTVEAVSTDTIPNNQEVTVWKNADGRKIEMRTKNGEISSLIVDGKVIDPSEYDAYQDELDRMHELSMTAPTPPMPPAPPAPPTAPKAPTATVPAVAPVPSVPPVPPVPGALPPPPPAPNDLQYTPTLRTYSPATVKEQRTSTTTIIREKNGNGYAYRVESDGDGSEVIVRGSEGIAMVNGQKIKLDSDSVFIIEKQEITKGPRTLSGRNLNSDERFRFRGVAPDVNLDYNFSFEDLPDLDISPEHLENMEVYKLQLKDYNAAMEDNARQWKEYGKVFDEKHQKDMEKYLKQWEQNEWKEGQPKWEGRTGGVQLQNDEKVLHELRRINPDDNVFFRSQGQNGTLERELLGGQIHVSPRDGQDNVLFIGRQREPFGRITSAMERDGLIDRNGEYNIVLEEDKLKVNGKRMPNEVHQKYLEIFEKSQGYKVTGKTKIEIAGKT